MFHAVPPLYDSHNHYQDEWLTPHHRAIEPALRASGLRRAVVNGTDEADWPLVAELAHRCNWILPGFGLHPWHAGNRSPAWQAALRERLVATPGAAVGEIGLDRWIIDSARPDDPRLAGLRRAPLDEQREVFAWQLALAVELGRAASIHCLRAFGMLRDTLESARRPARGFLLHAYGGPAEMVESFADLGAYFSFNGAFLDEDHAAKREAFRVVPADRLLVETDAPAMPPPPAARHGPPAAPQDNSVPAILELPPAPNGERLNHPANIAVTYVGLAALRGMPLATLAAQIEENFIHLFG